MRTCFVLVIWLIATHLRAETWVPSEALLDAVRHIESADGRYTVGDQGRSLGDYQLSEAAWLDVNAWRKSHGTATYDYANGVWAKPISRAYAADYLKILRGQLRKRLNRCPSAAELYTAYNMGMTSFARCQFRVSQRPDSSTSRNRQLLAVLPRQ